MRPLFILLISLLCAESVLAKGTYQIDVILFSHAQSAENKSPAATESILIPISKNAIALKPNSGKQVKTYHLLSPSQSRLRDQYYLLSRKPQYRMLAHYSWIQPASSQSSVALPMIQKQGWEVQGTLRVRHSNYYLMDAELQYSPPENPNAHITLTQKQRLKGGEVYYLDHAQIGMLISIH